VFASNDVYGVKASTEVGDATYCELNFLSVSLFHHSLGSENLEDLNSVIDTAKSAGSNIFIILMPAETAGRLLYQGWKRGLFKEGTQQIFGPVKQTIVDTIKGLAKNDNKVVKQIMTGYMGVRYDPFYNMRNPDGQAFIQKFKNYTTTLKTQHSTCSSGSKDDTSGGGVSYFYRNSPVKCAATATEFPTFDDSGKDMYPYAPHAYDAVYGLAFGLHALLEGNQCPKSFFYCNNLAEDCVPGNFTCMSYKTNTLTSAQGVDALMLHIQMVNAIAYNGSTGYVHYYEGMKDVGFDDYARGDREQGHFFGVYNFQNTKYDAGASDSFGFVGRWTVEESIVLCTSTRDMRNDILNPCYNITYNTYSGQPALDMPSYMTAGCCSPTAAPKTADSGYNVIKIGGYFSTIDRHGKFNDEQAQMQAAFIMAINEINKRTDILPTTKLVYTIRGGNDFFGAMTASEWLAQGSFGGFSINGKYYGGVDAVVGAGNDVETKCSDQLFAELKMVQVHTVSMDTDLGVGQTYPYKIQTVPIESFQGMVWQHIMCTYFEYTRFSVWATNDNFGTKATMESGDGTYCPMTPLTLHSVRYDTEDFSQELDKAIAGGSRIHLFFVPAPTAARIIEQGHERGLFGEGVQILGAHTLLTAEFFSSFKDKTKVKEYLKGALVVSYAPNYNLRFPTGQEFLKKFRALPPTVTNLQYSQVCHQDVDDSGTVFLYRDEYNETTCTGLIHSTYDKLSLYPNTPHAYDAAYALAHAFDIMVDELKMTSLNSDTLHELLMLNVSFDGATGYVKFFEGMSGYNGYAEGDREEGHTYLVYNFNDKLYDLFLECGTQEFIPDRSRRLHNMSGNKTQYPEDGWSLAFTWTVENGIELCDPEIDGNCKPVVYNTFDGKPALDRKVPIHVALDAGIKGFLIALGVITLLLAIASALLIVVYRASKFIMSAQPPMLAFMVFGSLLCGIRIILDGVAQSDGVCGAKFWLGHICFSLIFGGIFLKTYRLHKIVNNKTLKRVVFTNTKITLYMLAGLGVQLVYLAITTGVAEPRLVMSTSHVSNQEIYTQNCGFKAGGFAHMNTALYALEALFLIWGMNVTWAVRDVPDAVNETAYIVQVVSIMLIILCFVFPLVFLLNLPATTQQLISSLGFFISCLVMQVVLFGSKAFHIRKEAIKKIMETIESVGGRTDAKKRKSSKYKELEKEAKDQAADHGAALGGGGSGAIVYSDALFKKKDYAFKVTTARDQIAMWRLILMKLEDTSSDGTGTGSGTHTPTGSATETNGQRRGSKLVNGAKNSQLESVNEGQEDDGERHITYTHRTYTTHASQIKHVTHPI
jgi:gamma-aminobutyric acid type B receptor